MAYVLILHVVLNISINKQILQDVDIAHQLQMHSVLAKDLSRDPSAHTG